MDEKQQVTLKKSELERVTPHRSRGAGDPSVVEGGVAENPSKGESKASGDTPKGERREVIFAE